MKRTIISLTAAFVLVFCVSDQTLAAEGEQAIWRLADGTVIDDTSRFIAPLPQTIPGSKYRLVGKGESEVRLEVIVGIGGRAAVAAVRGGSSPEEIAAAIEAAERAVFTPAKLNGVPVAVRYELRYSHTVE
ncbi:MAG TPA: energy transducer TonB [Thermoanaerobaculia bacterium]